MTNPGQQTPWAKIPIPTEGKVPDVPVDLASVMDPLDTLLKNVIGGAAAPTAPLSPSLIDASASIGSLNATQSTQAGQISTLQGQVNALSVTPWAASTRRSTAFSLTGSSRSRSVVLSYQIPSFTQRRLLAVWGKMILGWSDSTTSAARGVLQFQASGTTTYTDRVYTIVKGQVQTMSLFCLETIEAGASPRVAIAVEMFDYAGSSSYLENIEEDPRLFMLALPWTGSTVPSLPPQS